MRAVVLALMAIALAATLIAVAAEWRVMQAAALLASSSESGILPYSDALAHADSGPPRAALIQALTLARAAERATDAGLRRTRLEEAGRWLDRAMAGRPHWGEAQLMLSYLDMLEHGAADPRTRAAFEASYAQAPYLSDGVLWRIRYALDQWGALDPKARAAVANEAAWYSRLTDQDYWQVMQLIVGTPIELPVMRVRARIAARALHDSAVPQPD